MVGNQPPAATLFHPDSGKAIVTGNWFAVVLPNHRGETSFDGSVSIDANLHVVCRDRLKFKTAGREVGDDLWLSPHRATWPYPDEIICVEAVKCRRFSINLCLNAFPIGFPYLLVDASFYTSPRPLALPEAYKSH